MTKALCLAGLVIAGCSRSTCNDLSIMLRNQQSDPIKNVTVSYSGGKAYTNEIGGFKEVEFLVQPAWESSLRVDYQDAHAAHNSVDINVYFEKGWEGKIAVNLPGGDSPSRPGVDFNSPHDVMCRYR